MPRILWRTQRAHRGDNLLCEAISSQRAGRQTDPLVNMVELFSSQIDVHPPARETVARQAYGCTCIRGGGGFRWTARRLGFVVPEPLPFVRSRNPDLSGDTQTPTPMDGLRPCGLGVRFREGSLAAGGKRWTRRRGAHRTKHQRWGGADTAV